MSKSLSLGISVADVDKMFQAVNEHKYWLEQRTKVFLQRLASEGLAVAKAEFRSAVYDGDNDVSVSLDNRKNGVAIVAVGSSVLFIEFGTGVVYPDNHPEAGEQGMERGKYGQGKGSQKKWGYYGNPGTNGVVKKGKKGNLVVITQGNPANMSMYKSRKAVLAAVDRIAKEVYR